MAWSFAGLACIVLGILPWVSIAFQPGGIPFKSGLVILVGWSSLPITLGAYLLYVALRKTKLIAIGPEAHIIQQQSLLLGWRRSKEVEIECVYLVRHRQYRRRRVDEQFAIFIRNKVKKYLLANEHTCAELLDLFAWLESNASVKCIALRDHGVVGDPIEILARSNAG